MVIDRVSKLLYNEPITVTRIRYVEREKNSSQTDIDKEIGSWPHKTPIKMQVLTYDLQGKLVGNGPTLDVYA